MATTQAESDQTVICDTCGGEYHFCCVGLDILPRLKYKCPDCVLEIEWNDKKDFTLHNSLKVRGDVTLQLRGVDSWRCLS